MFTNIQIITNEWIDIIILNNKNIATRKVNNDSGRYVIYDNILEILWKKWGLEKFTKVNDIYYNIKSNIFEIHLENNDWNDIGLFDIEKGIVTRKFYNSEFGTYTFKDNILYINWKNWGIETFYQLKYGKHYVNTTFGNLIKNSNKKHIKIIAIVFPQFHEIPENNQFWGNNFTEWTLLSKIPRIVNGEVIKQPHSDIGYFNLKDYNHRKYMKILADHYNIYGFCYYHYWFKNKKVMYEPTELMLIDNEPNKPYFFCWANESWTRRWDGGNNEILLAQDYDDIDGNISHFHYLLQFFKTKNYIKKFNKPIFIFYRIEEYDIKNIKNIMKLWNNLACEHGFNGIHFMRFLGPFNNNIELEELDGFVQFSPGYFASKYFDTIISEDTNKIFDNYDENKYLLKNPDIKNLVNNNTFFSGYDHYNIISNKEKNFRTSKFFVYDGLRLYDKILENTKIYKEEHRGISVNWNNSPRRNFSNEEYDKYPHYYKNINCELFGTTLFELLNKINNEPNNEDDFLFISAWNEWNEQAILEPNNEDGYDFLKNLNTNYLKFYDYPKKNINILNISHNGGGTCKYSNDLKNIFINYNFIDFDTFEYNIDYNNIYKSIDIVHINSILFNNLKYNINYFLINYFKNSKIYLTIHDYQWLYPDNPNISKDDFYKNKAHDTKDFINLLKICDKIIFPCNNIYNNYNKYINLSEFHNKIFIVYHNDKIINNNFLVIPDIEDTINISFVGNFTNYKGSKLFKNICEKYKYYNNKIIVYHIFGTIDNNEYINMHNNIVAHNYYKEEEIINILHENKIHGIMHLSIFEESYCYALTNSINSGIPIYYINHGAFSERLIFKDKYFPTNIENIDNNYILFLDYIIANKNSYNFYKLNNNVQPNRWYLENYN
jgi:hypothetical protein